MCQRARSSRTESISTSTRPIASKTRRSVAFSTSVLDTPTSAKPAMRAGSALPIRKGTSSASLRAAIPDRGPQAAPESTCESAGRRRSALFSEQCVEEVVAALDAAHHAGSQRRVAGRFRWVVDDLGDRRLPLSFAEQGRVDGLGPFRTPPLGVDDPLRGHYLAIDAAHFQLAPVGLLPCEVPRAARAQIDFANRHRPALRLE